MRYASRRRLVAVAAACAVGVLAWGAPVAAAPGDPAAVRGVTATEIVVGGLGAGSEMGAAAAARFTAANQAREIPGGRTIRWVGWREDGGVADTATAAGRALVETDQVFAIVPAVGTPPAVADLASAQRVPVVGWGTSAAFCGTGQRWLLAITGCRAPEAQIHPSRAWPAAVGRELRSQGKAGATGRSAVLVGTDDSAGTASLDATAAAAGSVGFRVVSARATVPAAAGTTYDWAAAAQAVLTADGGKAPEVVFLVLGRDHATSFGRALVQAGYKGVVTNASTAGPAFVGTAAGWSVFTDVATAEAPAAAPIVTALQAAGINPVTPAAVAGWLAADLFVAALRATGRNLTPDRFRKVASRLRYEVPGVVGPTVFPRAFTVATPCGQLAVSNATAWTVTSPYACDGVVTKKGASWVPAAYPSLATKR